MPVHLSRVSYGETKGLGIERALERHGLEFWVWDFEFLRFRFNLFFFSVFGLGFRIFRVLGFQSRYIMYRLGAPGK